MRIIIFLAALSVAAPARGGALDAPPPQTASACPQANAEAPPVPAAGTPTPGDDFKLVYSCASATPSL